jgi:hypothetical protein
MTPWYLQKTFWSGLSFILTGVLGFYAEVLTPEQTKSIMTIFGGLTIIFLRQGVEKTKNGGGTE